MSTFQKKLQQDRNNANTSNAGLKWDPEDDKYLLDNVKNGVEIGVIALALKRTEGSIKTRIIINIINMARDDANKISELSKEYNVSSEDIQLYEQKKEQREQKRGARPNNHFNDKRSSFPSNEMAEILHALTLAQRERETLLDEVKSIKKMLNK